MTASKKTANDITPPTDEETLQNVIAQQLSRIGPLEEVIRQRDTELEDYKERIKYNEEAARRTKNLEQALATSEAELKIYRTLMLGWPAGQDIVDQLNRARYDDYEDPT